LCRAQLPPGKIDGHDVRVPLSPRLNRNSRGTIERQWIFAVPVFWHSESQARCIQSFIFFSRDEGKDVHFLEKLRDCLLSHRI